MLGCLTAAMDQVIGAMALTMLAALPWVTNPRRPTLLYYEASHTHVLLLFIDETCKRVSFSFSKRSPIILGVMEVTQPRLPKRLPEDANNI